MSLPQQIHDYFNHLQSGAVINPLLDELLSLGDILNDARRDYLGAENENIKRVIADVNAMKKGFTLEHKEGEAKQSPIRRSRLRELIGIPEEPGTKALSRDTIKIKIAENSPFKHHIRFDAAANYKDGNHNWGVHANIEDESGNITHAAIYMPELGQIYVADQNAAHIISFPQYRSANQDIKIQDIKIGQLVPKFNAETGSWHSKGRALVKTLFTLFTREEVGGSLRESGMKEAPFVWVGLNRFGYSFIGNLKKEDGRTGTFIAEKAGATIVRFPITSDTDNRDAVFALHPDLVNKVLKRFVRAIRISSGDITIDPPSLAADMTEEQVKKLQKRMSKFPAEYKAA